MVQLVTSNDSESKVLHILHELAKQEGVTPTGWIRIRIMQEAKRKGLIDPAEPIRPSGEPEEKQPRKSIDEWVWED